MPQKQVMIELPSSPEAMQHVLQILLQYGLISKETVHDVQQEKEIPKPEGKSRWAKAAERIQAEDYLKGHSREVQKLFREFRNDFEM